MRANHAASSGRHTITVPTRLLIPLVYMAGLLVLSSIPGDLEPDNIVGKAFIWIPPTWQNLLHVPFYAGLAISWIWALEKELPNNTTRLATAFILTCAWGLVDESYQLTVPGRYGSFTDLALNMLGAALAIICVHLYFVHRSSKPVSHQRD